MHFQVEILEKGRKFILRNKEARSKVRWCFSMLKLFEKGNNIIIVLCEQTKKIQCMYLAFRKLKKSSKKDHQVSES